MKNSTLRQKYMTISRDDRQQVIIRKRIEEACNISTTTFYNYISGVTRIPDEKRSEISKIFGLDEKELFPEYSQMKVTA